MAEQKTMHTENIKKIVDLLNGGDLKSILSDLANKEKETRGLVDSVKEKMKAIEAANAKKAEEVKVEEVKAEVKVEVKEEKEPVPQKEEAKVEEVKVEAKPEEKKEVKAEEPAKPAQKARPSFIVRRAEFTPTEDKNKGKREERPRGDRKEGFQGKPQGNFNKERGPKPDFNKDRNNNNNLYSCSR